MARDWRRAVFAAFSAAMLGCACAPGASAQSAEEESQDEKADSKAKKKQDPADAQRTIEAALQQLQAGKASQALQAVSATVAGGNLPPAIMAKALYVRGMAYRRQGRPAQAISDLTSALWLKGGLGGDEREEAVKERSAAYADAGLADPGESQAAPKAKSAAGGGTWLSGIFGGGGSQEATSPAPTPKKIAPAPAERVEPPPAPKATVGGAWTSQDVQEPAPSKAPKAAPPKTQAVKAQPPPAPSADKVEGRYLVQLAAMRTEAEALALATKAKREHGSLLASRSQSINRQVFGNMGAFYRVRFGPFASAQETQAVCAQLQGSGIDCLPVNQ
jgi:cell division septation protein DedD